jgi:transposase
MVEKASVVKVCIDDFALKKRQRYGTVMVDMETRKIVDMIESREGCDVSRWLAGYPNISVVSRDGSHTYAAAITQAHPAAMQVSDRFHLVKNLCDRATLVFHKLFQGRLTIPATPGTQSIRNDMLIAQEDERMRIVKKLRTEGRTQVEIGLLTGLSMRMVKKYINMRACDISTQMETVREREHIEAVNKCLARVERVKALHESGLSITQIAQKTGFCATAVTNYLASDFSPVNAHYGKQREGKLEPYRDDVLRWKSEGLTYHVIHERIKALGYTGTQDAIRGFVSKECRIRRDMQSSTSDEPVEFIDKKWLIRLLYKPVNDLKGITTAQLSSVYAKYPLAESVINLVNEFKLLLKDKNLAEIFPWMNKAAALNLCEIDAFIGGLKQDIDAVINAITTNFSNGLVEGTVNKIKLIKRIMYGRCRFSFLRNKCLLLSCSE